MFAIFESGGAQHKAELGRKLVVQKLFGEVGTVIQFDKVCLLCQDSNSVALGAPWVSGAQVEGKITRQFLDKKVSILKFRRRKHSMKRQGHRQPLTEIEITGIKSE